MGTKDLVPRPTRAGGKASTPPSAPIAAATPLTAGPMKANGARPSSSGADFTSMAQDTVKQSTHNFHAAVTQATQPIRDALFHAAPPMHAGATGQLATTGSGKIAVAPSYGPTSGGIWVQIIGAGSAYAPNTLMCS